MLTSDQLSAIDRHLRKDNWLLNDELITELTDHYVAGIESRLAQGANFDVAIREIRAGFGGRRGLLKMEENFQHQQSRQVSLGVHHELQTFFVGKRVSVTTGIFILFYCLNSFTTLGEPIWSFLRSTDFICLILIWLAGPLSGTTYKNSKQEQVADIWPYLTITSSTLVRVYVVCCTLLFGSKFLTLYLNPYLPVLTQFWIIACIQTMVVTYALGNVVALHKLFSKKTKTV